MSRPSREKLVLLRKTPAAMAPLCEQLALFERELEIKEGLPQVRDARAILMHGELLDEVSEQWREQHASIPLMVICADTSFARRQRALRAGATAFATLPIDAAMLLDRVNRIAPIPSSNPFSVFVLDDDESICNLYSLYLKGSRSFCLRTFLEPEQMFEALREHTPDLFILDYHLREGTGADVARVLRQDHGFLSVPIVFLSNDTQAEVHFGAMGAGGDQFLRKPIGPEHFRRMMQSTISRFRKLRAMMSYDSLTQLHNHTSFKEQLSAQLAIAARHKAPLSLVMMDVDFFKDVNDTYGHPVGDRVLRGVAHLLKGRLRRSDIIGRYGGDEFAVIMPGTHTEGARKAMEEVRAHLAELAHMADDMSFCVTLSAGIAAFPTWQDEAGLTQAADNALYKAKMLGRDRVCVSFEEAISSPKDRP